MKKSDLTTQEMKFLLKAQGVTVRPAYTHDDYMYTSFTMPYPLKKKLDRVAKKYELTRSRLVQMLLESMDEDDLLSWLDR